MMFISSTLDITDVKQVIFLEDLEPEIKRHMFNSLVTR